MAMSPTIETDPQPDMNKVKLTVTEDGMVSLDIGSDQPDKPERNRSTRAGNKGHYRNLAEDMDEGALNTLAAWLMEAIQADDDDRAEWLETVDKTVKYLGVKLKDPASEVAADGTIVQTVSTAMLETAAKLWGTGCAELLPSAGPVKVLAIDPIDAASEVPGGQTGLSVDPAAADGAGIAAYGHNSGETFDQAAQEDSISTDQLAQSLEDDLNWYLTKKDRGYYPDFSQMLWHRYLIGPQFREIYRDPIKRMPVSRWVTAQDFIVQGNPTHIDDAGRITVRKRMRKAIMRRMMMSGEYREIELVDPTGESSSSEIVAGEAAGISAVPTLPRDYEHVVYECHCELGTGIGSDLQMADLDDLCFDETGTDPGYPLPYTVVLERDTRVVLAIRRDWKKGDDQHERRKRFVKYGFIPGWNSFYDYGLIHLVGNPTLAATMLQRSTIDLTLFNNFPAWVMKVGPASKFGEGTVFRPNIGEALKLPWHGPEKISDIIMPFPYRDPSQVATALVDKLESDIRKLGSVVEVPVGEGRIGNTPVGTILAYIESTSQVSGALHKADHATQGEEFELLRELIADEPEVLWRGNPTARRKWQTREEVMSPQLSPQADPNTPSQVHRLLKVQGQIMLSGLPQFQGIADQRAIYQRATEVLSGSDARRFTMPQQSAAPPPPPDPKIVAAQIKAKTEQDKGAQKQQEDLLTHNAKMEELRLQSSDKAADRQAANERESMKTQAQHQKTGADMVAAAVGHGHDEAVKSQDRAHDAGLQATDRAQATQEAAFAPTPETPPGEGV